MGTPLSGFREGGVLSLANHISMWSCVLTFRGVNIEMSKAQEATRFLTQLFGVTEMAAAAALEAITELYALRPDGVTRLDRLGLSSSQQTARKGSIGGSDARVIAKGDPKKLLALAEIFRGERVHEDLSDVQMAQLGHWDEPFNAAWFEMMAAKDGLIEPGTLTTRHGEVVAHPHEANRHVTLDGYVLSLRGPALVEMKGSLGFETPIQLVEKFWPQLQHGMWCCRDSHSFLSVIHGRNKFFIQPVEFDPFYMADLAEAEARFMQSVERGTEPRPVKLPKATLDLAKMVEVDMTGINEWADAAARYLENCEAEKKLETAKADIKKLFPANARRVYGHGVEASKAKNGAVRIIKQDPDESAAKEAA